MRVILKVLAVALIALIVAGCDLAPPPPPTPVPTDTPTPAPTATVTPTLGPREFINGVFCWESPIDVGEFNLLRFFDDGTVLEATVAPFADCWEARRELEPYLTLENAQAVGHGEYFLSGDLIRFELAAAHTNQVVGEVTGIYEGDKMILTKGGATQEYIRVETGD